MGQASGEDAQFMRNAIARLDLGLKDNPELKAHLEELRRDGSATDAQVERMAELAGKLSQEEQEAIGLVLVSLALNKGVSPEALARLQGYRELERVNALRESNRNYSLGFGAAVATGLGLYTATPVAAWATKMALGASQLPEMGVWAIVIGVGVGTWSTIRDAGVKATEHFRSQAKSYGVHE